MKYKNEQGKCPKCGSEELDYGAAELEGDMMYFPYTCKGCGQQGEEWYNMQFNGHNVITEDGENIEL